MNRNRERLEVCYRDLASRYGESDELVREFKSAIPADSMEPIAPIPSNLYEVRSYKPARFDRWDIPVD
jgi:hypothetical protein